MTQPNTIGVEHVGLATMHELAFEPLLESLVINGVMRTAIVGSIIARIAVPGSELANYHWLTGASGLGDLLKEKLGGCPLVNLGVVCDGRDLIGHSPIFAGNAVECGVLIGLEAPAGALEIMDRGIVTAANLAWLVEGGDRYLVLSRQRERRFDGDWAIDLVSVGEETIQVLQELSEDRREARLNCRSPG